MNLLGDALQDGQEALNAHTAAGSGRRPACAQQQQPQLGGGPAAHPRPAAAIKVDSGHRPTQGRLAGGPPPAAWQGCARLSGRQLEHRPSTAQHAVEAEFSAQTERWHGPRTPAGTPEADTSAAARRRAGTRGQAGVFLRGRRSGGTGSAGPQRCVGCEATWALAPLWEPRWAPEALQAAPGPDGTAGLTLALQIHANGAGASNGHAQSQLIGARQLIDRSEFVRVVQQSLIRLGLRRSAAMLQEESVRPAAPCRQRPCARAPCACMHSPLQTAPACSSVLPWPVHGQRGWPLTPGRACSG